MKTTELIELQARIIRHRTAGENLRINPEIILNLIHEVLTYRAEEFGTSPIIVDEVTSLSELGTLGTSSEELSQELSSEEPEDVDDSELEDDSEPVKPVGRVRPRREESLLERLRRRFG